MIRTELTPNEIVGYDNMKIFIAHLEICKSSTNSGEFPAGRLNKEVGQGNRDRIVKIYEELRDNGFYPLRIQDGKVVWGVVTRSECLAMFEGKELASLQRMPEEQLMKMGRSGYLEIIKSTKVQEVEDYEINRETVF